MILFITHLTIIYLLTNDLHNKDVKWEVASFIWFSKSNGVWKLYIYIYKFKWNVKKRILNFLTLFLMQFLLLLENIIFLVMIGDMVSMIKVRLVLSLNLVLWLYLIVDYWFNFLSECNGLFYYTINFLIFSVRTSLFYFFTSPYSLFVFQLTFANDIWFFFFFIYFLLLCNYFSLLSLSISLSLSLSLWATYHF